MLGFLINGVPILADGELDAKLYPGRVLRK